MLGMMIPIYATIIPLFSMFNQMPFVGYICFSDHTAYCVRISDGCVYHDWILENIPRELEEAAVMDGSNIYQIFFKIITPIAKPSIVTVAVITFIDVWNDLLIPQIFLTSSDKMTLPVGLTEFEGLHTRIMFLLLQAVVITVIPSIVVYILLHKNIMEGMVAGAVKGEEDIYGSADC